MYTVGRPRDDAVASNTNRECDKVTTNYYRYLIIILLLRIRACSRVRASEKRTSGKRTAETDTEDDTHTCARKLPSEEPTRAGVVRARTVTMGGRGKVSDGQSNRPLGRGALSHSPARFANFRAARSSPDIICV